MAQFAFAWELGGNTGHVSTLLPIARAMQARGHTARFLLRNIQAGADLDGAEEVPREPAPVWSAPPGNPSPLNWGEILLNFGYHDPAALTALIQAWRERLQSADAMIANVAPTAHLAARTLGMPSFEIAQGFHVPPPSLPSPTLRDWDAAPLARLGAADRQVLHSINSALGAYGCAPLATIGEMFVGRAMLLTYPEIDVYPGRGPSEYFGITDTGEGRLMPPWPAGGATRVFVYLYGDYFALDDLCETLRRMNLPTLLFARNVDATLRKKHAGGPVCFIAEPMSVSHMLPQADLVICHGSHQMTAQALLAGKPLLMLPTQLEQFLITRRIVRFGAALGIAPDAKNPDFQSAITALITNASYQSRAKEFALRYAGHDRSRALSTMIARCEAAVLARERP